MSQAGWSWWVWGMLREALGHLIIAVPIWLLLAWAISPDAASVGTATFFWGRELRDWEIEALPGIMQAIGFADWDGLRPATSFDLAQLRHSLSGWLPVTVVCIVLWWRL